MQCFVLNLPESIAMIPFSEAIILAGLQMPKA